MNQSYQAEVIIAGGGLAGLVTAGELLDGGRNVLLIEKDSEDKLGGLAREAFGGVMLVDTPHRAGWDSRTTRSSPGATGSVAPDSIRKMTGRGAGRAAIASGASRKSSNSSGRAASLSCRW